MRILHLNLERSWRGGERQTLFTLLGLQQSGHNVALFARTGSELAQAAQAKGIKTYCCRSTWSLLLRLPLIACGFDVVHAQTAQTASVLALLRPLLKAATVFTRRTAFVNKKRLKRHYWKWSRLDALVAISAAAAQAPKALGLSVDIIPSAVQKLPAETNGIALVVAQYQLADKYVVFTASALTAEKDPATLIKAIAAVRASIPNIVCIHCGSDGDASAMARSLVQQLGLEQNYIFAGFKNNIGDFLAVSSVYASSSKFEALGTSVLDACLAGVPVVATDTGGHGEILRPDYGLLVAVGDAQALARKIVWLQQHADVAQAMAKRAQAMVTEQFSVPAMVQSYVRLYSSLRVLR